jgi:hypothetical protein
VANHLRSAVSKFRNLSRENRTRGKNLQTKCSSAAYDDCRTSVRVYAAQKGETHMKQSAMLTTASLLTILFMTLHLTGDILFKMSPAGLGNLFAVFVFVVQLYGTLVLGGRRAGYIIIFLVSVLELVVPVIHMKGTRGVIGGDIGNSGQAFLFVWTILALGITSTFSIILSARALLSLPWRRSRRASTAA